MKKLRKMLCFVMVLVLAMGFAGCSGMDFEVDDEKFIEESAAKISEEITSGQFVIDGVIYQFPMPLKDWLDNGWHVSSTYDNAADFRLDPYYTSNQFELFDEENKDYVQLTVYNDSDKAAPIEECMVYSLRMSTSEVDVVFPKGMTKRNNPEDILAAYGEPDAKGDSKNDLEAIYYFSDELGQCYVELDVIDNDYTEDPFYRVYFGMISAEEYWDMMVAQKGVEGTAEFCFDAAMKASFYADFKAYSEMSMDSLEGAQELYDTEVEYFTECLLYYIDITEEYITTDVRNRVNAVSKEVLSKVKWDVKSVDVNAFNEGTITVTLYPTDFFYVIDEDLFEATDAFNTKYFDVDYENLPYEEYDAMEKEYTEMMVAVLEKNAALAGTLDAVECTYKVNLEDGFHLADGAWDDVDDRIMDLLAEEE